MESSINSSCCSEAPTMSAKETKHKSRRIAEENTDKETMGADDEMMKPQLPLSELLSLATEKCKHKKKEKTLLDHLQLQKQLIVKLGDYRVGGLACNEHASGSLDGRRKTMGQVMEALADPNTHIMGLYSSNENVIKITATLPEKVIRRVKRDNMFDVILKANVTNKPNIKKIQDEIAGGLSLILDKKSKTKRASILHDGIKMRQKILIMICELYKGIDLRKVGIPYGAEHSGCKILLTSTNENVLSNQMHTQKNFLV